MKKRVLHVINSLTIGGAEMLLVNSLSPGGLNEHVENYLVYFIKGGDHLVSVVDKNVKQFCLDYKGGSDIVRLLRQLRKIITNNKIDIIHTHLNPSDFYVNLVRPKNIPQVHTLHIAYSTDLETRNSLKFLERTLFFNKQDCNLIFLSEFNKKDFLANVHFKGRSFVVPNFVDDSFFLHQPKRFTGSAETRLKVIAVGNFRDQKNYFYLLDIFKLLTGQNIQLDIYGGGDLEKYRKVIDENKLNVNLKGQITNVNDVIADYDLFIMSSTNEGFPLSVFEAMAAGVPVMLTDIGPLTAIVKDNALYFKLNDAAAAAAKLIAVEQNKIDINEMAVKAKTYAEQMVRRDIYVKNLLDIYNQLNASG
jgi:glycosyltransferase involved in cell wall biosynthesis